jgi:hypothetical protein
MDAIDTFEHNGLTIQIVPDDTPESPREWGWPGTIVCFEHRRYELGDEQVYDPDELAEHLKENEARIVVPVYFYEHSVMSMSARSFVGRAQHAEWDSSCAGAAYLTADEIRKHWNVQRISKRVAAEAEAMLIGSVETYGQYLSGDIYGYIIEDAEGEHVDSCFGFYGYDDVREQAIAAADGDR